MARHKKQRQGKNDANTGKVPQEVAKDKSSLKSVGHEDHQHRWHHSVQNLPPGQIIDIPFLKDLAIRAIVPIAYCTKFDIDKVENFVPAYLHRFTRHQWQLLDELDYVLSTHYWDEQDDCIMNLFGTYMQHPEEQFVEYFGGVPVAALEQGTPKRNFEAFEEGSTRCSPRKNPEALEQGTISRRSPRKNPDQGSPICSNTQKLAEEINTVAAATEEMTTVTGAVASNTTAATIAVTGAVAANAATTETTVTATTAAVTTAPSNNNANPRSNVQAHPRKTNPRQLPLNKHRPSQVYYHSAFTTYPRHHRPENVASTPDVLDTLLKCFSSRARVDSQKNWNSTIESWTSSKNKLSILSLPPLTQESNVGDDGLMSQSSFDVNIKEEDYLSSICPDPHLFVSCMPSDDQLKKHYTKLLEVVIELRQILSRGKTLSAIRRRGELMDLKIADISAKDVMLEIDDAEFQDWCAKNQYARLWHCSQVNKSAILQLAIKTTISRSPHPHLANFFDDLDDIQPQFVGFVTAQIQHNVVTGLHIHSFALYYTQNMVLESKPTNTTVVICALTSRIHILSMMQDRVFQLLQLLQHDVTGDYSISLTNQFIGTDVVLNDLSISGYEDMGFNVKSMTQDVHQGQFTINTEDPIPLMSYSDRFTWAKYGHFILFSGLIPVNNKSFALGVHNESVTANHRDCLISFLQTDPDGAASFVLDARSARLIEEFLKNTFRSLTMGTEKGYFFDKVIETNADSVVSSIFDIAKEATKIPLAIFTDLFHHRFKKKPYLESTLELLRQFYIKLADHSNHFCIFVGDLHKYCLHCTRCHRAITRPDYIGRIMELAPAAMLWHLGIASDADDFYHCPLILPLPEAMEYSWSFFEQSMEEIDDEQPSPFLQCNAIMNHGLLSFCEATKVDLQSWSNSKKNGNQTHDTIISNTISLVSSLLVDLIDVDMAIQSGFSRTSAEMKETPITVTNSVIWNRRNSKEKKPSYVSLKDAIPHL